MKDVEETSADLNGSSASEFDPERYWRRDQWVISLKPNGASQEKSSNLVLPKRSVPQVLFKNLFIKDYEHIFCKIYGFHIVGYYRFSTYFKTMFSFSSQRCCNFQLEYTFLTFNLPCIMFNIMYEKVNLLNVPSRSLHAQS